MEIVERFHDARGVEARCAVVEVALVSEHCPQFSAEAGFHQHVKILPVFERFEQLHYEVTVSLAHNSLLGHDVLLLSRLDDLRLLHLLQGEGSRAVAGYLN